MTSSELRDTATRLRRATSNRDVLALCDAVLAFEEPERQTRVDRKRVEAAPDCPSCAAAKEATRLRVQRYRAKLDKSR